MCRARLLPGFLVVKNRAANRRNANRVVCRHSLTYPRECFLCCKYHPAADSSVNLHSDATQYQTQIIAFKGGDIGEISPTVQISKKCIKKCLGFPGRFGFRSRGWGATKFYGGNIRLQLSILTTKHKICCWGHLSGCKEMSTRFCRGFEATTNNNNAVRSSETRQCSARTGGSLPLNRHFVRNGLYYLVQSPEVTCFRE